MSRRVGLFFLAIMIFLTPSLRAEKSSPSNSETVAEGAASGETQPPAAPTPAIPRGTEGYSAAKWGMSPEEVKEVFPGVNFTDDEGKLVLLSKISGEKALVLFSFAEARLYWVGIGILVQTVNRKDSVSKFNELEKTLSEKYGEPKLRSRENGVGSKVKDTTPGTTDKGGYFSEWETPETAISLVLSGEDFDLNLRIIYESKEFRKFIKKPAEGVCGIQSCHGLDVVCGAKVPEICDAAYHFGDNCRQFVNCQVVNGECQMVDRQRFDRCVTCVTLCKAASSSRASEEKMMAEWSCEARCMERQNAETPGAS